MNVRIAPIDDQYKWPNDDLDPTNPFSKLTVLCKHCHAVYRTWYLTAMAPTIRSRPIKYCQYCGSEDLFVSSNIRLSQLEIYAQIIDLPFEILEKLYELWNPIEDKSLLRFFQEFEKEAKRARRTKG